MHFNICDPGHIPARNVCICSDHMCKWWNLCHQTATLTYICEWAHENAVNQCHIRMRVREADRKLCHRRQNQTHIATKAETIPTPWQKLKELQILSYSPGDPAHRLPDGKTTLIIIRIRNDVTTAMRMSMVRYWENIGEMLGDCWDCYQNGSSLLCSAIRLWLQWD